MKAVPGTPEGRAPRRLEGQTELFPSLPAEPSAGSARRGPSPGAESAPSPTPAPNDAGDRAEALRHLLELAEPVRAGSRAAAWLKERRVFRRTWDGMGLRSVDRYAHVAEALGARFPASRLEAWGLFNKDGHLRFYRHSLLVPWLEDGRVLHLEAHAPDPAVTPGALSLPGPVACPYNAHLLDGAPGRLYLCADTLETLALTEAGFPAVGALEGVLRPAWLPRFRGKSVYVAFGADADGEAAAAKAIAQLTARGIEAHRLHVPPGKHLGDWLAGK